MINCGIILPSLEISQLAFETITQINNKISNGSPLDYRIFFEDISPQCVQPLCGVMNISEMWSYSGFLVSTTLDNTLFSLKLKTDVRRIFYLWDLEWLRNHKNYMYNLSILRDPRLLLAVRSKECAEELFRYANRHPNFIANQLSFIDLIEKIK